MGTSSVAGRESADRNIAHTALFCGNGAILMVSLAIEEVEQMKSTTVGNAWMITHSSSRVFGM